MENFLISGENKICIHPLVILSISDYYTRIKINSNNSINKVYGGLLGNIMVNKCEISSSIEFLNNSKDDTKINFDLAYIEERRKLSDQFYPNSEIVGFFMTNSSINLSEEAFTELSKVSEFMGVSSPIFVVLSTDIFNCEELPLAAYKIDKNTNKVIKLDHIIEGNESERICLDTVTKSTNLQTYDSAMIQNMNTYKNALNVLKSNLKNIQEAYSNNAFQDDNHFNTLLNELMNNYPDSNNAEFLEFIKNKTNQMSVLNNIFANTISKTMTNK